MVRFFASGALFLAASAVNAAEPPAAADIAVIEACLADNRDSEQDRGSLCSGLIAGPCQARPGGETTRGVVMCLQRELAVWDGLLNRYYADMIRQLDGAARTALRE
ncbi:MAG TPA: lysozyme inhibitor LprI family protein, partial [Afifellaceae bacterium]|nr:lysozyme inhibitor LprI family protein [Afifellaceae bacterium]